RGRSVLRRLRPRATPEAGGLFAGRTGRIYLEVRGGASPAGVQAFHPSFEAPVGVVAGGDVPSEAKLTPVRRGLDALEGMRIVSRAPYGITRQARGMKLPSPLVVFPSPADDLDLQKYLSRAVRGEAPAISLRPGIGHEFLSLREHRPEDGMRRIHWKASARTGQLLSRVDEKVDEQGLTISVATTIPEDTDVWRARFERALSLATAAILQAAERGIPFRLVCGGRRSPMATGLRHRNGSLQALALLEPAVGPAPMRDAGRDVLTFSAEDAVEAGR
ncbi:MAG: DUF58 domain-containing protein, partial [Acidobacteriota bacterium]